MGSANQGAIVWTVFLALTACTGGGTDSGGRTAASSAESCMTCHNGSPQDDYAGPGLENPHPWGSPTSANIRCSGCHGGDPNGADAVSSHVPPPPQIGDEQNQESNAQAYFNRLTLTGIDKFPDYTVGGVTYTALDYLRFINPGDLRVTEAGMGCGMCHVAHSEAVAMHPLATEVGMLGSSTYLTGDPNHVPENQGLHQETAGDLAFRAISDPTFFLPTASTGGVSRLIEFPVYSVHNATGPEAIHDNQAYNSPDLSNDVLPNGSVVPDSHLAHLFQEQVAFTCGDCHLGSAGANNRYGDFRSSGCTACHMPYSLSGRSTTGDPNVNRLEPLDPDDIDAPELPHPERHLIRSVAKTVKGQLVQGIDDYACAGCHQGSNRTVMQYWGIRLDQNQDLRRRVQYPADPVSFTTTRDDTRLFDPVVGNRTFNGRNANQYILHEDYDGDGRDDTPADVHYEAGLGCIDCHGSFDLHGDVSGDAEMVSRMEQAVAIRCETCHGTVDAYAATTTGTSSTGQTAEIVVDAKGNPVDHVVKESSGDYILTSRLTGQRHYVRQTLDVIVDNGRTHPTSGDDVYNELASFAMGRADGSASTGLGPQQTGGVTTGFSHSDSLDCATCHSAWTNNCVGCHLWGEYDTGNNFSNITGDRIVFREDEADFVYQNPVLFNLGIDSKGKVSVSVPNSGAFFKYTDLNDTESEVFEFTDRNGGGNNRVASSFPSLSHNAMMQHSIRGKVEIDKEGARNCVACHLTDQALADYRTEYDTFRGAMAIDDFASLDFDLLKQHIGQNPGNQLNSPMWVHSVAGLGSGLYLFDENGCPVNPLDDDANRKGCEGVAPSTVFDVARVRLDVDRMIDAAGNPTGSNAHPMTAPATRPGGGNAAVAGPLPMTMVQRLTDPDTGIVLDSWIDADGQPQGDATTLLGGP